MLLLLTMYLIYVYFTHPIDEYTKYYVQRPSKMPLKAYDNNTKV